MIIYRLTLPPRPLKVCCPLNPVPCHHSKELSRAGHYTAEGLQSKMLGVETADDVAGCASSLSMHGEGRDVLKRATTTRRGRGCGAAPVQELLYLLHTIME